MNGKKILFGAACDGLLLCWASAAANRRKNG